MVAPSQSNSAMVAILASARTEASLGAPTAPSPGVTVTCEVGLQYVDRSGCAAVGGWDDEIGTPDIEKDGNSYVVTFDAHDSTNRLKQRRAMVRMSSLTQDYAGARSQITLTQAPAWADYGVGMADMTKEPDGYWYIIFEAFSGATGACGRTDTATTVGIARSTDVRTWTVRQAPRA